MPGLSITCDCDVLVADGGTRTASITGGFVALSQALQTEKAKALISSDPIIGPIAGVSVGIIEGQPRLDLDYILDVAAEVDMNVAMNHKGEFVEVQATGEKGTISREQFNALLDLATSGINDLIALQQ